MLELVSTSRDGLLWWRQEIHTDSYPVKWRHGWWSERLIDDRHFELSTLVQGGFDIVDQQWQLGGFECGRRHAVGQASFSMSYWKVDYTSMFIALALLSAYLLLSTPRQKQTPSVTQTAT